MGNLEHCANLFSNANNRVHNWHFFSQNITKGLWDNSRCKISGLELNQDSSISSGSASGKAKTLREKRTGKRVFKRVHFRAWTCAPWDLHKNSLRVFQIHMRTWGLLGGQVGRVNLASLVLTASARLPQNLLLHSGRSAPGSTGGQLQWGPWAIQPQLLTSPKPAYHPAVLSSDHKCCLLLNILRGSQAGCLHSLYLYLYL